jgi:hypothetical protein
MDFGYPQNLSPEILKLYITQEGVRSPFSSKVRCLFQQLSFRRINAGHLFPILFFNFQHWPLVNANVVLIAIDPFLVFLPLEKNSLQTYLSPMQLYKSPVLLVGAEKALFIRRMR